MRVRRYHVRRPAMNYILVSERQPVSAHDRSAASQVLPRLFRSGQYRSAKCLQESRQVCGAGAGGTGGPVAYDELSRCPGRLNRKVAPWGMFAVAHIRPPCASMIERQIDSPMPMPPGLVV